MTNWLRGVRGGFLLLAAIASLVVGALGWATLAALRVEREQLAERAEAEHAARVQLALWRLDGRVSPLLAREDGRPFDHYSTLYASPQALTHCATGWNPELVLELSPLLRTELPAWMPLHFQITRKGWESPQAPSDTLRVYLGKLRSSMGLVNMTPARQQLLNKLVQHFPSSHVLTLARERSEPPIAQSTTVVLTQSNSNFATPQQGQRGNVGRQPTQPAYQGASPPIPEGNNEDMNQLKNQLRNMNGLEGQQGQQGFNNDYILRSAINKSLQVENSIPNQRVQLDQVKNNSFDNGSNWLNWNPEKSPSAPGRTIKDASVGAEATVQLSPLFPLWATGDSGENELLLVRLVRVEKTDICQGVLLDVPTLQNLLTDAVADLFPQAQLKPIFAATPDQPDRAMTVLPFELDPGAAPLPLEPGWSGLRVGLALAWGAAGMALLAVALGGWSLFDLSERRIRFVSAVTHELRTPLTTLRLYLDMLVGGLVRNEEQRHEYLHTLNTEADRLNRLVGNVLDFSRLEKRQPQLNRTRVLLPELLAQVASTWQGRCQDAGKTLVVENRLPGETMVDTDPALVQQILANLLDNACKYSRGAADPNLWLRVRAERRRLIFEVEDRGPGVPGSERRSIFRAFRRGRNVDITAGGVGLGLALAHRWAQLLGGRLALAPTGSIPGACFQLWLPF